MEAMGGISRGGRGAYRRVSARQCEAVRGKRAEACGCACVGSPTFYLWATPERGWRWEALGYILRAALGGRRGERSEGDGFTAQN